MRRRIVAGNWKMNLVFSEADDLVNGIAQALIECDLDDVEVVICPPFPYLELTSDIGEESDFSVGAQNVSKFDNGAYTGEISAKMLEDMNIYYCIVGHSERRKYFNETNEDIAEKVKRLFEVDITPIVCVGESLEQRESGNHFGIIKKQVVEGLFHLSNEQMENVIIAYEPIWAIGTGRTATSQQAQEIHSFIRGLVAEKYGKQTADNISILYGGSCNTQNAKELFAMPDVDGGLIGGASLKADDFVKIATSF
ncbi:MAG: triose-phosphate isomerase [Bacteroidales bacterium]|jgi:triosephosphate isomerase|nr:triose-phosphate isomerase [Bacteroidales bacterium]